MNWDESIVENYNSKENNYITPEFGTFHSLRTICLNLFIEKIFI